WLRDCSQKHALCRPPQINMVRPILLVDVIARSLIKYSPAQNGRCNYVALSYIWGNVHQEPAKLGQLPQNLPQTIEDSIEVVKSLGQRYLWVDSLCIDQADEEGKARQI
ncbi:uncharacterized protein A1O5_08670, partial [Cladophialophora psammophila CBS 110553]